MLVVIEIEDWSDNEGLLHELRMLQKSDEDIKADPGYDPEEDEGDETMRLKTDVCVLDVARVVGVAERWTDGRYAITPLDA